MYADQVNRAPLPALLGDKGVFLYDTSGQRVYVPIRLLSLHATLGGGCDCLPPACARPSNPVLLAFQGMLTQPVNVARAIAAATAIGRAPDAASGAASAFLGEPLDPADASAAQVTSAIGKGRALDALRSTVTLQSAALAAAAAMGGEQGERAPDPGPESPLP